jgi:hypothetical protein
MLYWAGRGFLLFYMHKELNLGDTTMGLLSRKPKMSIEDCCRDFYDSQIFKTKTLDSTTMDSWSFFLAQSKELIAEDDQAFLKVDSDSFWHEMTALRMAVFGLVCSLKVKHKTELIARQVFFTKRYLEDYRRQDIWDTLLGYNDVIDHSVFMNADGQSAEIDSAWHRGKFAFLVDLKDTDMKSGWKRHRVTLWNSFRFRLFEEWIKSNVADSKSPTDEEEEKLKCLSIALKRVGADITRADCVAVKLLTATLAERLGYDINLNQKALLKLGSLIFGFYEGAKKAIKDVVLQG